MTNITQRVGQMLDEAKLGTVKLNTGDIVSAREGEGHSYKGQKTMQAYKFSNRTQAEKHAQKVGGTVIKPGRVFYVQMKEDVDEAKKDIKADLSKVRESLKDAGVGRHNIFYDEKNKRWQVAVSTPSDGKKARAAIEKVVGKSNKWIVTLEWGGKEDVEIDEDAKMGKQSDDQLKKLYKAATEKDQSSPANKSFTQRVAKEMRKRGIQEEVEIEEGAKFSASQLDKLKAQYSTLQKMNPGSPTYKKMKEMLGKMSKEQLKQIRDAKIKFLQYTAADLLRNMKEEMVKEASEWEEMFGDETYQDSNWDSPDTIRGIKDKIEKARSRVKDESEKETEHAHAIHQQKTNESKKTYQQFIKEARGSTAVFTFGRFNPPTTGHEKLLKVVANTAQKERGDYFICMSHSQDARKNPLTYEQKTSFMKMIFPEHRLAVIKSSAVHALELATQLYEMRKYSKIVMVVGSDRVKEFDTILNKYNDTKLKHGYYKFENIDVISAGDRDPDADGAEGMSASKMRAAVTEGNYDVFKMGIPSSVSERDSQALYNAVARGMKIQLKEDGNVVDVDEVLSPSQRRRMGQRMRIMAKKPAFIMKRKRSLKRAATKGKLEMRARKSAIKMVVKKFYPKLRGKQTSDLSYGERGKISKIVKQKATLITRFAKRMVKDKRKQDIERRRSMNKPKDK